MFEWQGRDLYLFFRCGIECIIAAIYCIVVKTGACFNIVFEQRCREDTNSNPVVLNASGLRFAHNLFIQWEEDRKKDSTE